jgi:predicted MFS family arabinose efflux permease
MLVASGLGSYFSSAIAGAEHQRLVRVLSAVAVLVAVLAFAAGPLVAAVATWVLPAKIFLTALAVTPAAFLMGVPFPTGLRWLNQRHAVAVRWAWSLNAAASVLGSALAILLAIYLGLRATMLVGAGLYVCALVVAQSQVAAREN